MKGVLFPYVGKKIKIEYLVYQGVPVAYTVKVLKGPR